MNEVESAKKSLDSEETTIEDLDSLEALIKDRRKNLIRENAHKLIVRTLGKKEYIAFIKDARTSVKASNGKEYAVHTNGYVEVLKDGKVVKDGQLQRGNYPAEDAIVTFITYAKFQPDALDRLWGCGNISLKGGSLKGDEKTLGDLMHAQYETVVRANREFAQAEAGILIGEDSA